MPNNERNATQTQLFGVDFSGARDAGSKIWICRAERSGKYLQIRELKRCDELPASGMTREIALAALCKYLQRFPEAVVGFDFSFGVAQQMMNGLAWRDWIKTLQNYAYADDFRAQLMAQNGGREARRETDIRTKTPMSPVNWRVHRQTFHGIRDVLLPLCENGARIFPFSENEASKIGLLAIEICPASTLKRENLYRPYKGRGAELAVARREILEAITSRFALKMSAAVSERAIENAGGDALDAILACVATARFCNESPHKITETERREGRVWT